MTNLDSIGLAPIYDLLTRLTKLNNPQDIFDRTFSSYYDTPDSEKLLNLCKSSNFTKLVSNKPTNFQNRASINTSYLSNANTIDLLEQFVAATNSQSLSAAILERYKEFIATQANSENKTQTNELDFAPLILGNSQTEPKIVFKQQSFNQSSPSTIDNSLHPVGCRCSFCASPPVDRNLINTQQQDSSDKIENRKSDEADERLSKKHLNS